MKKLYLIYIVMILATILIGREALSQEMVADEYVGFLSGRQEVPPVDTNARSLASFRFVNDDSAFVGVRWNFSHDQVVEQVHIHMAPAGEDGPIILNMRPTTPSEGICVDLLGGLITYYSLTAEALRGPLEGMTLTDLKNEMATGNTYLNLHTPENPGGWIRGQMIPRADETTDQ